LSESVIRTVATVDPERAAAAPPTAVIITRAASTHGTRIDRNLRRCRAKTLTKLDRFTVEIVRNA
jgi:hypothetical protein